MSNTIPVTIQVWLSVRDTHVSPSPRPRYLDPLPSRPTRRTHFPPPRGYRSVLTRQQLYELYWQGPDVIVRLVEQLYEHIAATEPPEVRTLRLTVEAQLAVIKRLQRRLKRVEEKLAHEQCLNCGLKRRLSELGSLVGKDSHNSSLPPSLDPPSVRRTEGGSEEGGRDELWESLPPSVLSSESRRLSA